MGQGPSGSWGEIYNIGLGSLSRARWILGTGWAQVGSCYCLLEPAGAAGPSLWGSRKMEAGAQL